MVTPSLPKRANDSREKTVPSARIIRKAYRREPRSNRPGQAFQTGIDARGGPGYSFSVLLPFNRERLRERNEVENDAERQRVSDLSPATPSWEAWRSAPGGATGR